MIAPQPVRMADVAYEWSSGWNEKTAKDAGYIEWRTEFPRSWEESIWQGPHFTVANPFAKQPNEFCRSKRDYSTWDLMELPEWLVPRTNYQRACAPVRYDAGLDHWNGQPFTDYWRVAWRKMTQPGPARSLHAALLPPGPGHTGSTHSLGMNHRWRDLALVAGLWSSLPYDYMIKVSGKANIYEEQIARFPAPLDHPAASYLLLRALRLNCLTRDYAPLWEQLYEDAFAGDTWTPAFADWPALGVADSVWTMDTPLRSDYERRAAFGGDRRPGSADAPPDRRPPGDDLPSAVPGTAQVRVRHVLRQRRPKIAKDHHAHGVKQQKDDFDLLQAYLSPDPPNGIS